MELHLDLTSDNKVFNCLTPQGNWYFHKFGKRNFPVSEINYPILLKYLKSTNVDKILCDSFYGDSFLYSHITNLAEYCNENNIAIGVGVTAQVDQAYENKVVLTVAETSAASEHSLE